MSTQTTVILGGGFAGIAAANALRRLAPKDHAIVDGVGCCYLETGGGRAIRVDGSFFELPNPLMRKQPPDESQFKDKLDWVARLLAPRR